MLRALLCYLKQGRMTPDSFSEVEKEKRKRHHQSSAQSNTNNTVAVCSVTIFIS